MFHKLRVLVWGEVPPQKEKSLLFKLDWFILSFACLLYWVNYLDRLNLTNAYVSGMKEEIGLHGNQFNIINTCFTVGYTISLVPHNLILLRIRPSIWLSFCCFAWGLLILGMYKVEEFYQLCVIRFFQALFESSTFVGVHLILSQWYTEVELAKRTAIFTSSGLIGNIFSSTLQAAIHKSLDGVNGISGWRWLFIIDFIITVPIAVYGLFFFPDTPKRCKVFYLTPEEVELAASRVPEPTVDRLDWSVFRRVLGRWPWWGFSFLWVLGGENESYATNSLFALYLQYYDYDISARNHYPMGIYALGIVFTFIFAIYIDYTKARHHYRVAIMIALLMIIATALILSGYGNPSYNFGAHYLSGAAYGGQTAFFAWASVVCQDDLQERAVVLGSMNMFSNAVNAWWSILFYSADTVPKFRKGCYAMFGTSFASICVALVIWYLWRRQERNKNEIVTDNNPQSPKDQVIVTEKEV